MRLMALCALSLVVASATPALAHHGWGGYQEKDSELTGTLETAISLAGPHATAKVRVNGDLWDIVLAPPARTSRAGLHEKTIPVGSQVTVRGHRHLDPKKLELKTERVIWSGRTFDVYPDRQH